MDELLITSRDYEDTLDVHADTLISELDLILIITLCTLSLFFVIILMSYLYEEYAYVRKRSNLLTGMLRVGDQSKYISKLHKFYNRYLAKIEAVNE